MRRKAQKTPAGGSGSNARSTSTAGTGFSLSLREAGEVDVADEAVRSERCDEVFAHGPERETTSTQGPQWSPPRESSRSGPSVEASLTMEAE